MSNKHKTQAMKDDGLKGAPDGVNDPPKHEGSASTGGHYPNPHDHKSPEEQEKGFGKHGGSSVIAYHGPEQLGEEDVEPDGAHNSVTKSG